MYVICRIHTGTNFKIYSIHSRINFQSCSGYTAECSDLRSYILLLLITLMCLYFLFKNNNTLGKSEVSENSDRKPRRKRGQSLSNSLTCCSPCPSLPQYIQICIFAWGEKNIVLYSTFYLAGMNHTSNNYYFIDFVLDLILILSTIP